MPLFRFNLLSLPILFPSLSLSLPCLFGLFSPKHRQLVTDWFDWISSATNRHVLSRFKVFFFWFSTIFQQFHNHNNWNLNLLIDYLPFGLKTSGSLIWWLLCFKYDIINVCHPNKKKKFDTFWIICNEPWCEQMGINAIFFLSHLIEYKNVQV